MDSAKDEMLDCIVACQVCHDVCLAASAGHCLESGGAHVEPAHMRLMLDCAEISNMAADFMLRGSPRHGAVCAVCAGICGECAISCAGLDGMEECVEACENCAESCSVFAAS